MSHIIWLGLIFFISFSSLQAEVPFNWGKEDLLARRFELRTQAMTQTADSSNLRMETQVPGLKSVRKAVLFSAVLPGSGQFYAKSYVKAAVFLAVEVTAWTVNISYTKKGDQKDSEFKQYAQQNWNELRYWSYVNWDNQGKEEYASLLVPENYISMRTFDDGRVWYVIDETYFNENRDMILNNLRQIEEREYSHRLPTTTTQQYYEMIGKYPGQFGNAWSDASFDRSYSGPDNITYNNNFYMDMRDEANRYYDIAQYGLMAVLINHVVSSIDAGFTTRNYNRRQVKMEMSYNNLRYKGEYVNMFGVNLSW
jgi:hypothetical protein